MPATVYYYSTYFYSNLTIYLNYKICVIAGVYLERGGIVPSCHAPILTMHFSKKKNKCCQVTKIQLIATCFHNENLNFMQLKKTLVLCLLLLLLCIMPVFNE